MKREESGMKGQSSGKGQRAALWGRGRHEGEESDRNGCNEGVPSIRYNNMASERSTFLSYPTFHPRLIQENKNLYPT